MGERDGGKERERERERKREKEKEKEKEKEREEGGRGIIDKETCTNMYMYTHAIIEIRK